MASSSFEEHKTHMHELMRRFAHYGVVLNKDKCVFGVSEITFLGHLVTQEGIKPVMGFKTLRTGSLLYQTH